MVWQDQGNRDSLNQVCPWLIMGYLIWVVPLRIDPWKLTAGTFDFHPFFQFGVLAVCFFAGVHWVCQMPGSPIKHFWTWEKGYHGEVAANAKPHWFSSRLFLYWLKTCIPIPKEYKHVAWSVKCPSLNKWWMYKCIYTYIIRLKVYKSHKYRSSISGHFFQLFHRVPDFFFPEGRAPCISRQFWNGSAEKLVPSDVGCGTGSAKQPTYRSTNGKGNSSSQLPLDGIC